MKTTVDIPGRLLLNEDPKAGALRNSLKLLFTTVKEKCESLYPNLVSKFESILNKYIFFPGAQPVSLCREHLSLFKSQQFVCCEKSDGVRYMYIQLSNKGGNIETFLLERKGTFFQVVMEFLPIIHQKASRKDRLASLEAIDCILDGELIEDSIAGKKVINYLIYDALWIGDKSYMMENYTTRLAAVLPFFVELRARNSDMVDGRIHIFIKDLFLIQHAKFLLYSVIPNLPHKNDGLIFTRVDCPYYPGTCNEILKWKPAEKNTIDCRLVIGEAKNFFPFCYELHCMAEGSDSVRFDYIFFENKEEEKTIIEKIKFFKKSKNAQGLAECYYDYEYWTEDLVIWKLMKEAGIEQISKKTEAELNKFKENILSVSKEEYKGGWKIEKIRGDKINPNHIRVAKNIKKSIDDKITSQALLSELIEVEVQKLPDIPTNSQEVSPLPDSSESESIDLEESGTEGDGISFDFISRKRKGPEEYYN